MSNESGTQTASILDKTDWRKIIQKYLDQCIALEGSIYYSTAVKRLISAVAATFPNWDARSIINKHISKLRKEYSATIDEWVDRHPDYWIHPGKRLTIEPDIVNAFYKDIYDFIIDLLAIKRMLLWGNIESRAVSYDELKEHI